MPWKVRVDLVLAGIVGFLLATRVTLLIQAA